MRVSVQDGDSVLTTIQLHSLEHRLELTAPQVIGLQGVVMRNGFSRLYITAVCPDQIVFKLFDGVFNPSMLDQERLASAITDYIETVVNRAHDLARA